MTTARPDLSAVPAICFAACVAIVIVARLIM
jgi:hypothetical protein